MKANPTKTSKPTRTARAAPPKPRGDMKPSEITPLIMAARKAYGIQVELGNLEPGVSFNSWRHDACMAAVSKPGITACNHDDFRPLMSHFQHLAGDDSAAFRNLMKTGKPTDHAAYGDTHEARRQLAHLIGQVLSIHIHLATTPADKLLAECVEVFAATQPGVPWEHSGGPIAYRALLERQASIGTRVITVGYIVYLVRQKTRRPDLTLGKDWQAGLADRCTVHQLGQIRNTLVNRIAAVEGTGSSASRNKSQRKPKARTPREPDPF